MKPTPGQTADTLTQIEQLVTRLRHLEPDLRNRAADTALDGYPRQSGAGGGQPGQGDPTGTTVALRIDHPQADVLGHAHRTLTTKLNAARRLLEEAESVGRQALPPPTRQTFDDGCASCWRIKIWSPIHRTRRCRRCYEYLRAEGEDPPVALVRARSEGRRISAQFVAECKRNPA